MICKPGEDLDPSHSPSQGHVLQLPKNRGHGRDLTFPMRGPQKTWVSVRACMRLELLASQLPRPPASKWVGRSKMVVENIMATSGETFEIQICGRPKAKKPSPLLLQLKHGGLYAGLPNGYQCSTGLSGSHVL